MLGTLAANTAVYVLDGRLTPRVRAQWISTVFDAFAANTSVLVIDKFIVNTI